LLQAARLKGYNFRLLSKPVHPRDLLSEVGTLAQQSERESKQEPLRWRVGALAGDSALGAQEATAGPQTVSTNDGLHGCSSSQRP
jgi:hypothetical protein